MSSIFPEALVVAKGRDAVSRCMAAVEGAFDQLEHEIRALGACSKDPNLQSILDLAASAADVERADAMQCVAAVAEALPTDSDVESAPARGGLDPSDAFDMARAVAENGWAP